MVASAELTTTANSASWVIEGELDQTNRFTPPLQEPTTSWTFRVTVSDQQWSIRTTQTTGERAGEHGFSFREPGTLLELSTGRPEQTALQRANSVQSESLMWGRGVTNYRVIRTNAATDSMAILSNRVVPNRFSDGIPTLWLAFGSQEHLESKASKRMIPHFGTLATFERTRYPLVGYMTYLDKSGRFPASVVSWNEGYIDDLEGPMNDPVPPLRPVREPFNKGFTNSIYRVLQHTNMAGQILPLRFEQIDFWFAPDATRAEDVLDVRRYNGRVRTITRSAESPSPRPDFPMRATYVLDQRIRAQHPGITEARYVTTNASWLDTAGLTRLPEVKRRIAAAGAHRAFSPIGWLLVLTAFFGFPVWAIWSRGGIRDSKQQNAVTRNST